MIIFVKQRNSTNIFLTLNTNKIYKLVCLEKALNVSPVSLERALLQYSQNVSEKPFDIKVVPTIDVSEPAVKTSVTGAGGSGTDSIKSATKPNEKPAASRQDMYAEQLGAIPEFAHLGPLFKSSAPIELTEADTEYNIKCVKHTFTNYFVFQVRLQLPNSARELIQIKIRVFLNEI